MNLQAQKIIGPKGKCPFIIRDDDINFFTSKSMLDSVYHEAWERGFKTTLCVVPNQKAIENRSDAGALFVPQRERGKDGYYPISWNQELVVYLNQKIKEGKLDVVQHGFSHEYIRNTPEFGISHEKDLQQRLDNGLQILEDTFQRKIRIFVPPNECLSRDALQAIRKKGLTVLRRKSVLDTVSSLPFSSQVMKPVLSYFTKKYLKQGNEKDFSPSFAKATTLAALNRNKEIEALQWSVPSKFLLKLKSPEAVYELAKKMFLETYAERRCFLFMHHYYLYFYDWEKEMTLKELYMAFCKTLMFVHNFKGVWKTTLTEFLERATLINQVAVKNEGSALRIFSPMKIEDFALRIRTRSKEVSRTIVIPCLEPSKWTAVKQSDFDAVSIDEEVNLND